MALLKLDTYRMKTRLHALYELATLDQEDIDAFMSSYILFEGDWSKQNGKREEHIVDYYRFSLDFDLIQAIGGFNAGGQTLATSFDIDYADGLGGPDTVVAVFDEQTGELLLVSRDSNIADDQRAAGSGAGQPR